MSIKAMVYYLDHKELKGNEKLAMVILGNYANDQGECFPGVERIAEQLNITRRGTQNILSKLQEEGHLDIDYNQGINTGTGRTNLYKLTAYKQSLLTHQGVNSGAPLSEESEAQGVNSGAQGVNADTEGVNSGSYDPSVDPSVIDPLGDNTAREASNDSTQLPPPDFLENNQPSPTGNPLMDIAWGKQNGSGQKYLSRQKNSLDGLQSKLVKCGLTTKQFRELVDVHLTEKGTIALADSDGTYGDRELSTAQEFVLTLCGQRKRWHTPEGIRSIWQSWREHDKRSSPSEYQLLQHAEQMANGKFDKEAEAKPQLTFKQWCQREYNTDIPQVALGLPLERLQQQYEQAIRIH